MATLKSYALTTVQRTADYMGLGTIAANSSEETLLTLLINTVTEFIENYLGFRVKSTVYTNEEYDTEYADTLRLTRYPVSNVTLQVRTNAMAEDDWETVDSQYYHVDSERGILYGAGGWKFAQSRKGYRVTYTSGYTFDNATTFLGDTEAGDLELAAWMLIATVYNRRKGGVGVKSESIGDYSVTYQASLMESDDIKAILDKYADIVIAGGLTPPHYS